MNVCSYLVHGAQDNRRVLVASLHLSSPLVLHPVPTCVLLSWKRHIEQVPIYI